MFLNFIFIFVLVRRLSTVAFRRISGEGLDVPIACNKQVDLDFIVAASVYMYIFRFKRGAWVPSI